MHRLHAPLRDERLMLEYKTPYGDGVRLEPALHSPLASPPTVRTAPPALPPPPRPPALVFEKAPFGGPLSDAPLQQSEPPHEEPHIDGVECSPVCSPVCSPLQPRRGRPRRCSLSVLEALTCPDILSRVVYYLSSPQELVKFMCVCPLWFTVGAQRVWAKPPLNSEEQAQQCGESITTNDSYARFVLKLNFAHCGSQLTSTSLLPFHACRGVQRLSLSGCTQLQDEDVAKLLVNLPELESIDLMNTRVGNDTVCALADHCRVQTLMLGCSGATDYGLRMLGEKKGAFLKRIRLSECPLVTPHGVLALALKCPRLQELNTTDLVCCSERVLSAVPACDQFGFTDDEIRELLAVCPHMKELTLSSCWMVTAQLFAKWSSGLTIRRLDFLRSLALVNSFQITDTTVRHLVVAAPRLRQLNLSKCPLITDRSLAAIALAYRSQLVYLHVGHCAKITDAGVCAVVQRCVRLTFFDAGNCVQLTDAALVALATLPRLRRIGLVRCPHIGHHGVVALAYPHQNVPERPLERLHLSYCPNVSLHAIRAVTSCCRRLVHLSLTGIPRFLTPNILRLRRPPPEDFNPHQKEMFCVFSGAAIPQLRRVLDAHINALQSEEPGFAY